VWNLRVRSHPTRPEPFTAPAVWCEFSASNQQPHSRNSHSRIMAAWRRHSVSVVARSPLFFFAPRFPTPFSQWPLSQLRSGSRTLRVTPLPFKHVMSSCCQGFWRNRLPNMTYQGQSYPESVSTWSSRGLVAEPSVWYQPWGQSRSYRKKFSERLRYRIYARVYQPNRGQQNKNLQLMTRRPDGPDYDMSPPVDRFFSLCLIFLVR
jgi:hypothetical protein